MVDQDTRLVVSSAAQLRHRRPLATKRRNFIRQLRLAAVAGLFYASLASAPSEPAILEYSGIVSVDGHRFNGPGSFVFRIQETNGITWWSSGELLEGSAHTDARSLQLQVTNGGYTVRLG